MAAGAFENRIYFDKLMWFGIAAVALLFLGFLLASNQILVVLSVGGLAWLLLLPYHSKLAVYLSIATFSSALIVPFFPGRPFLWEFAALLAWTGLIVTVSMRRFSPDFGRMIHNHKWMLAGVIGYCVVLIITMYFRGFGLRVLGSDVQGGRFYFQQLTCAIFPFLFAMVFVEEKTLIRLFFLQYVLTTTYLVSDFVFSIAPANLFVVLQFFELPGDAANFEMQSRTFGIRRFQSFYVFSQGFFMLLLMFYKLKDFTSKKGVFLIPLGLIIIGIGLLSGHRYLALILTITVLVMSYSQRFWSPYNIGLAFCILLLGLAGLYAFSERLPLAAQRAISFLPGIEISGQARTDGEGTFMTRAILRGIGWQMAPDYFWLGRGFGMPTQDLSSFWDPTGITMHVNQGRFYNGFIGLIINTSLFGLATMLTFLGATSVLAWRIIGYLRYYEWDDPFARLCSIVTGLWTANVLAFLLFHGDSEYALKTFALQAGVLMACRNLLERRIKALEEGEDEEADTEALQES